MSVETEGWQIVVAVMHLHRDMMRITEQRIGMSQTRFELMHELFHVDEMSQAELQQRLDVEGAVITRIVKQLEAMGLVTRRADPRDNRYTLVALTPEARRYQTEADAMNFKDRFAREIMVGLDDTERAQLLSILKRVQQNVDAIDPANT